ncbi:MAG: phosphatase PAP2 family protein [Pseudomonadota bacterium]
MKELGKKVTVFGFGSAHGPSYFCPKIDNHSPIASNNILKTFFFSLLLIIPWILPLQAEESISDQMLSPLTTNAKYLVYAGTLSTLTLLYFDDQTIDPAQEKAKKKPLKQYSKVGDYGGRVIPNAAYFLVMGTGYLFSGNNYYGARAGLMFKATLYSSIVTTALKYSIREPRPNNPNERNSFPSGHAAMAFSFASAVGMAHPWYWGLPAYLFAGFVSYSRMNDNRHFLHDVVAGATIGTSYGIGLALKSKGRLRSSSYFMNILPTDDLQGMRLALVAEF